MWKTFLIEVVVATLTMMAWCLFMGLAYEWFPDDKIAGPLVLASLIAFMVAGMVVYRRIEGSRPHAD